MKSDKKLGILTTFFSREAFWSYQTAGSLSDMWRQSVSQYHHVLKTHQLPGGGLQVQSKLAAGHLHGGDLHHLHLSGTFLPPGYGWHQGKSKAGSWVYI